MYHNRTLKNKFNRLHRRYLRLIYSDKWSTFEQLLDNERSVSKHIRYLQNLAIEMYNVVNGSSSLIMNETFKLLDAIRYNLQYQNTFKLLWLNYIRNGAETVSTLEVKIGNLILMKGKVLNHLSSIKKTMKK